MRDRIGKVRRAGLAFLVVASLATLGGSTARADSRTVNVESIRVGFQERYKVGTWTPIWIQLRGGADGFTGVLQVITDDQDGTPTTITQPVQVAAGGTQRVTAYVRPGSLDPDFAKLVFIDTKSRKQVIPDVVIGNFNSSKPPDSLAQDDYQILSLGHPQGVELIPGLPGFNADKNAAAASNGRSREVVIAKLSAIDDLLPGRWFGFDAVDVVVVDTNDKEILATLSGTRGEALKQWVQRGGHLVVAVSSNWQAVNDGLLADMLPLKVNGQTQVNPFESLESFTGGSHQVAFENAPTQAAKFEEIDARGGKVIASTLSTPLVVRGPYGFGRVTVIGLDIDSKPFSAWPDRGLFFVKALDLKASTVGLDVPTMGMGGRIMSSTMSDLASRLRQTLDQFEGVKLVPFAWVAGFILLYILLIGPGDYFFLKKVLKRMELTWITFPTIVVTVSLLAYYAAYVVKGTELRVNKIDVIDIDQEAGLARGVSWVNLFSPQNRDYTIKMLPVSPHIEMPTGLATEVTTPPGTEVLLSWFGAPEEGLRGMNSRGQGLGGFGSRGYDYAPEELIGVRIGIWSTKALLARWFGPAPVTGLVVDSDLQPSGSDRLSGKITNKLSVPMKNTIVIYGKQVYYKVGTVEPGASVDLELTQDRSLSEHLREELKTFLPQNQLRDETDSIKQEEIRADLVREILFHQADATGQETISSRVHHDLDLSGQLALGRPMVVAQVDRPGTQLLINGKSGSAKTEQTTVLRVILPLKKEKTTSESQRK